MKRCRRSVLILKFSDSSVDSESEGVLGFFTAAFRRSLVPPMVRVAPSANRRDVAHSTVTIGRLLQVR